MDIFTYPGKYSGQSGNYDEDSIWYKIKKLVVDTKFKIDFDPSMPGGKGVRRDIEIEERKDQTLKTLREEAIASGDYTKVCEYKRSKAKP